MVSNSRKRKTNNSEENGEISPEKQSLYDATQFAVYFVRALIIGIMYTMYLYRFRIQLLVNQLWFYLLECPLYNSVYFETVFTTTCYAVIIAVYPFTLHYIKHFSKYKIDQSVTYRHQTVVGIIIKAVIYMIPLATLDTFVVKKYVGVSPEIWIEKSNHWIQTTRALPEVPPDFVQMGCHLVASILLFDLIFFFIHVMLHRNMWLYKTFHRYHHEHDVLHPHVTDQLTVGERLALVLSANFALKCFNSHPLTRTLFIPVFVYLLIENHTGYDLPLGIHRIVPFGVLSGPVKHYNHHINGERNYQPFLNYMDHLFIKVKFYNWMKL